MTRILFTRFSSAAHIHEVTTRDLIGRFAVEHRGDPGSEVLDDTGADAASAVLASDDVTEKELAALNKAAGLIAGISGVPVTAVHEKIAQFRTEYLQTPLDRRPVTPETFAGGFRGRNPDTRLAPQDPATVWAHFRALHDPDAFPPSTRMIASVDLETAGAPDTWYDPAAGHIIEVGIVTYRPDGVEQSRFTQLVRPPQAFLDAHGTGQQELHGIGPELLDGQPDWGQVRDTVARQLAGCTMLAQNRSFEQKWLGQHLQPFDSDAPCIDPMPLSRLVNRGLRNHKLSSICEHLQIPYLGAHRATADAEMAAQAFFAMRRSMHDVWRNDFACTLPNQSPELDRRADFTG